MPQVSGPPTGGIAATFLQQGSCGGTKCLTCLRDGHDNRCAADSGRLWWPAKRNLELAAASHRCFPWEFAAMRMSWFTSLRAGKRGKRKRQQLKAAPLRVRQLERRRVLDAAVSSVVVSTVVVADIGQSAPAATSTTVNPTDAPPIVAPVTSPANNNSVNTA